MFESENSSDSKYFLIYSHTILNGRSWNSSNSCCEQVTWSPLSRSNKDTHTIATRKKVNKTSLFQNEFKRKSRKQKKKLTFAVGIVQKARKAQRLHFDVDNVILVAQFQEFELFVVFVVTEYAVESSLSFKSTVIFSLSFPVHLDGH